MSDFCVNWFSLLIVFACRSRTMLCFQWALTTWNCVKILALTSRLNQRNDSRWWILFWNINMEWYNNQPVTTNGTTLNLDHVAKIKSNCDDLGLQCGERLSGDFLQCLQSQNFTSWPNVVQSKVNSTINPQEGKVKIRLVASVRSKTNAIITISNFSVTASIRPIPKRALFNLLGLL